ncbi:MAG TPA: amino acid adenylation domain-containing protein [Thermoanaerobaculia bacterium]
MSVDRYDRPDPPNEEAEFSARAERLSPTHSALLERLRGGKAARSVVVPASTRAADPEPNAPFPLTDIQQAYWIGRDSRLPLGGVAAFGYGEFDVEDLDVDRLEAAWNRLIHRHPALRTVILPDGTQRILPTVPPHRIPTDDLRHLSPAERTDRLAKMRESLSHQVLKTDQWPLFDIRATKVEGSLVRVHVGFDTLIADARSFDILANELDTLLVDPDAELEPIGLTYKEYVVAISGDAFADQRERARAYWFDRVDDLPPGPELPSAASAQASGVRFVRYQSTLDPAMWTSLSNRAGSRRLTPSAVLLTAYAETLARWSSTPRFTLNLTLFNRRPVHDDIQKVVGCFTELSLLEVDITAPEAFEDRSQQIQKQLWSDLEHREVGAMDVMREQTRRTGVQPMLPVVFTSALGTGGGGRSRLGRPSYAISQTPQVSIDYQIVESDRGVELWWDVAEALFPSGMVRDMFDAHVDLIRRLADSEAAWTSRRPIGLPDRMRTERLALERTAPVQPRLLHDLVDLAEADRLAVVGAGGPTTRGELDALANRVAVALQDGGVRGGDLVGVMTSRGKNQVAAVLGVLRAGGAYVPLSRDLPPARLREVVERARLKTLVIDGATELSGLAAVRIDSSLPDGIPQPPGSMPGDLAYVIFTSGTTGTPKGVMISHEAAVNTVLDVCDRLSLSAGDAVIALSELSFDLSVFDIFGALAAGATIVTVGDGVAAKDPAHWADLVDRHNVTFWSSVPALVGMYADFLASAGRMAPQLRVALLSGDWIPVDLPGRIRRVAPKASVVSAGGATEAAIWSVIYPVDRVDESWKSIPYGAPLTNQTARVNDHLGNEVPDWVTGELYIGGAGVALGYWDDPARTAEQFVPDPDRAGGRRYRTGDNVRHVAGGILEFLGRTDSQVKVNGYRVDLSEIESVLLADPAVEQACVLASGPRDGARKLRAFVVTKDAGGVADVRRRAAMRLPEYMVPAAIEAIDELPLTGNGKVDRSRLASLPWPQPKVAAASVESSDARPRPIAALVADIVREVLDLESGPGPEDDLLQLGANSLAIVRVGNALRRRFGFAPRLERVFADPTVSGIAAEVEAHLVSNFRPVREGDPLNQTASGSPGADARRLEAGARRVAMIGPDVDLENRWAAVRTRRTPRMDAVPLSALAALLHPLRAITTPEGQRRLYPSAGALYPVRIYLSVAPGRVDPLAAGVYYFDPVAYELVAVGDGSTVRGEEFSAFLNQPIVDRSAFVLLLAAYLPAIAPVYGGDAARYATLEAGAIAQILREAAPEHGLSLCMIGDAASAAVRAAAGLGDDEQVVVMLAGGAKDDAQEWLPLARAQERVYVLERLAPGRSGLNVPAVVRLGGELDETALRRALNALAARHDALRMVFNVDREAVMQRPVAAVDVPLEIRRVDGEDEAMRVIREDALRPFDLTTGPTVRALVVRYAPSECLIQLTFHHLTCDEDSLRLALREVLALYAAHAVGHPADLAESPRPYRSYVEEELAASRDFESGMHYWLERLAGLPVSAALPNGPSREATIEAGAEAVAALQALAHAERSTLTAAVFAVFVLALRRPLDRDDVVIGIPYNDRGADFDATIGTFVNTLAIRSRAPGAATFRELLRDVRHNLMGAIDHADVPYNRVVNAVRPGRGMTELFDAWLVIRDARPPLSITGLSLTPVDVTRLVNEHSLKLDLELGSGTLRGMLLGRPPLWEPAAVDRLAAEISAALVIVGGLADEPLTHAVTAIQMAGSELQKRRQDDIVRSARSRLQTVRRTPWQ